MPEESAMGMRLSVLNLRCRADTSDQSPISHIYLMCAAFVCCDTDKNSSMVDTTVIVLKTNTSIRTGNSNTNYTLCLVFQKRGSQNGHV